MNLMKLTLAAFALTFAVAIAAPSVTVADEVDDVFTEEDDGKGKAKSKAKGQGE